MKARLTVENNGVKATLKLKGDIISLWVGGVKKFSMRYDDEEDFSLFFKRGEMLVKEMKK